MLRASALGVVLVSAITLFASGCGSTPDSVAPANQGNAGAVAAPPPGASASASTAPATVTVPEQLKFTAKTVDNKDFSGETLAGKAAVFWFWTPWCGRCQGESKNVARLAQQHASTVTFVGVAAQDQLSAMRNFVSKFKVDGFAHLQDQDAEIWKRFGVIEQPSYAFVSPDGTVEVVKRQLSENELTSRLRVLSEA
jgi:thiol-disulfide isomerase/thioredoxin